jgi:predicted RNase H-related nuclease YkuK (DUF458 family)
MSTMMSRQWKTVDGKIIENVYDTIAEACAGLKVIHIGTDSQQNAMKTEFVTVVVVHTPGKGGRAFYTVESTPRVHSLRERLLKEVWLSVQLGLEMSSMVHDLSELLVHVDANPNTKFKSGAYAKELAAMVVSQGFNAVLKPEAWAAMHVADHVVKKKVIGR